MVNCVLAQKTHPVYFENLKVNESCTGESVRQKLRIASYHDEQITLTYLGSSLRSMKLKFANEEVKKDKSFVLEHPIDKENIFFEFFIEEMNEIPTIYLKQEIGQFFKIDTIKILTGNFFINSKNKEIYISKSCLDTITLNMPFAGTQTDVNFFKLINGKYERQFHTTYYCCSFGNEIRIPKNSHNKYKIGITGCYTPYSEFEFELK